MDPPQPTPRDVALRLHHAITRGDSIEPLVQPLRIDAPVRALNWLARRVGLSSVESEQARFNRLVLAIEPDGGGGGGGACIVQCAIERNHVKALEALWSIDSTTVETQCDQLGGSLLHMCAWSGSLRVFRWLLAEHASTMRPLLEAPDAFGLTPLQVAYIAQKDTYLKWCAAATAAAENDRQLDRPPVLALRVLVPIFRGLLLLRRQEDDEWIVQVRRQLDLHQSLVVEPIAISRLAADQPPIYLSLTALAVTTGRVPVLDALGDLLDRNDRRLTMQSLMEQLLAGLALCEQQQQQQQQVQIVSHKHAIDAVLASTYCERLVASSHSNEWEGLLQQVALAGRVELINRLVRLGLDPDCSFFPRATLRMLPSEAIWSDETLSLQDRRKAVGLLFRGGCNWLPERYHDPQNFFQRLSSKIARSLRADSSSSHHQLAEFGKNPRHLWRQFCSDLDLVLAPDDVRWQREEMVRIDQAFARTCPNKPVPMHGACMVCAEDIDNNNNKCGPGGCACALCDECCEAYATNLHTTFGNDIVRCPTNECKKLLHPAFLAHLLQSNMLTEAQYRVVRRRQYRNMQLAKYPAWRFCSADCIGGSAPSASSSSSYMTCDFCFKTGCFKCGQQHASCDAGAQDAAFLARLLAEGAKLGGKDRPCPFADCGMVFHFDFGCNAVKCIQCKREWHW